MASFDKQTRTVTYTEYTIKRGYAIGEFNAAFQAAAREWLNANDDRSMPDDWAIVDADDDHIIIRITNEQVTPA